MSEITKAYKGWMVAKKVPGDKVSKFQIVNGDKSKWIKAWSSNPILSKLEDGVVLEQDLELTSKENTYNGETTKEIWLVDPPKAGARGGGVAKSDPAKNQTIKQANENNNATISLGNARNNATTIVGWAREDIPNHADINAVAARAKDYADLVKDIAGELLNVNGK